MRATEENPGELSVTGLYPHPVRTCIFIREIERRTCGRIAKARMQRLVETIAANMRPD
jgi:hypothetical protein